LVYRSFSIRESARGKKGDREQKIGCRYQGTFTTFYVCACICNYCGLFFIQNTPTSLVAWFFVRLLYTLVLSTHYSNLLSKVVSLQNLLAQCHQWCGGTPPPNLSYRDSTPCGSFVSLCSQNSSQGFTKVLGHFLTPSRGGGYAKNACLVPSPRRRGVG
jgi:hypothetical protein